MIAVLNRRVRIKVEINGFFPYVSNLMRTHLIGIDSKFFPESAYRRRRREQHWSGRSAARLRRPVVDSVSLGDEGAVGQIQRARH